MKSKLYLINKSPYTSRAFENMLKLIKTGKISADKTAIALLGDAVISLTGGAAGMLNQISGHVKVYALREDAEARGVTDLNQAANISMVSYGELIGIIVNEYQHIVNYL